MGQQQQQQPFAAATTLKLKFKYLETQNAKRKMHTQNAVCAREQTVSGDRTFRGGAALSVLPCESCELSKRFDVLKRWFCLK
jgi:hypothetical protein